MHYTREDIIAAAEPTTVEGWSFAFITLEEGDTAHSESNEALTYAGPGEVAYYINQRAWSVKPGSTVQKVWA